MPTQSIKYSRLIILYDLSVEGSLLLHHFKREDASTTFSITDTPKV